MSAWYLLFISTLLCCCHSVKDFNRTHTPLHLSKTYNVTCSHRINIPCSLCHPSVSYTFLPFSPPPTPYMLNLLHITKRSYHGPQNMFLFICAVLLPIVVVYANDTKQYTGWPTCAKKMEKSTDSKSKIWMISKASTCKMLNI